MTKAPRVPKSKPSDLGTSQVKGKKNATIGNLQSAPPAAEPVRKREWTVTQGIFIDAISEALISDETPDEVLDPLIEAVIEQYSRKTWGYIFRGDHRRYRAHVDENAKELRPEWKLDLQMAARLNRRAPEAERLTPADVSGRIRESIRDEVEREFSNKFLAKASMSELYFMRELLQIHDNYVDDPHRDSVEVYLAQAFEIAMDNNTTYLAIPESISDRVKVYVSALQAVEAKEVK